MMPRRNRYGDPLPAKVDVAAEKARIRRTLGMCPTCGARTDDDHTPDCAATDQDASDA